jgi:hypothetical protein
VQMNLGAILRVMERGFPGVLCPGEGWKGVIFSFIFTYTFCFLLHNCNSIWDHFPFSWRAPLIISFWVIKISTFVLPRKWLYFIFFLIRYIRRRLLDWLFFFSSTSNIPWYNYLDSMVSLRMRLSNLLLLRSA